MRRLSCIPIVHSPSDMGSLHERVRTAYIAHYGEEGWATHLKEVAAFWRTVRRLLDTLDLTKLKLRVYQDGLPICGKELEIVKELSATESPNYRILEWLRENGATITGTEDPSLLLAEREGLLQGTVTGDLMERRDRFMAGRISDTLRPDETGLLFIGALHQVDRYLPEDIETKWLLGRKGGVPCRI